jgi:hypothetical protein
VSIQPQQTPVPWIGDGERTCYGHIWSLIRLTQNQPNFPARRLMVTHLLCTAVHKEDSRAQHRATGTLDSSAYKLLALCSHCATIVNALCRLTRQNSQKVCIEVRV